MKKIQKKISLEQFKSRMPGIIDSYVDNANDYVWTFDINYRNGVPYTNYGLIPKSIELDDKTVSYNTLVNWYHFIEFYAELLSINLTCGEIKYNNAVEYYNVEKQPKYKLKECEEFDTKCQKILSYFANTDGGSDIVELYSYLTKTYFPKYVIEDEYKDIWNKSYLSLAEVHEWIKWFEERNDLYKNIENCSESDDCCDCEKYKKLGGFDTYNKLKNFILQIEKPSGLTDAYATIPIILSTTIDDMGEYSIFYEEWVPGHDYGNQGGVVVNYEGESYSLKEGESSSTYNRYKELEFNVGAWKKTEINVPQEGLVKKYAYNHDGKLFIDGDINIKNMSRVYNINTNGELGFYVIKGVPYRCNRMNVVNVNNKLYQVYYDYENNPYITIGKKNYYGLYDNGRYTFKFKNEILEIEEIAVVIVNNSSYRVNNGTIISNNIKYNKIHAYSVINGNKIYFDENYNVIVPYKDGNEIKYEINEQVLGSKIDNILSNGSSGVTYCVSDNVLYVHQNDYVIYDNTLLSGNTESKLSCFLSANLEVDNIGNKLPGLLQKSKKDEPWLTLPYKPKTIVHITRETDVDAEVESGVDTDVETSVDVEDEESCEGKEVEKVWCDYLESITFYYSDSFGNRLVEKEYDDDLDISSIESDLKTLLSRSTSDDTFGSKHFLVSDLKCEFKYHMGCIINRTKCSGDSTYSYSIEVGNSGVTYYDNVTLIKKQCEFHLNNSSFYMMNYYDMIFETKNYTDDTYGYNVTVPIAKFICQMNSFDNNNYVSFPLIREEYKLGSSSHEKIESDIYINRGTTRAFDNHIKLMEVRSLESLEQYGNGYFKIIKN